MTRQHIGILAWTANLNDKSIAGAARFMLAIF
jgi:hypothetical protein